MSLRSGFWPGFGKWVPKFGKVKCLDILFFKGDHNVLIEMTLKDKVHYPCIYIYNFIEVVFRLKNLNHILQFDILRNYSQNKLGVMKCDFGGFGCSNDTQTPCCLRHCSVVMEIVPTF